MPSIIFLELGLEGIELAAVPVVDADVSIPPGMLKKKTAIRT
jgi:hypothetical protein